MTIEENKGEAIKKELKGISKEIRRINEMMEKMEQCEYLGLNEQNVFMLLQGLAKSSLQYNYKLGCLMFWNFQDASSQMKAIGSNDGSSSGTNGPVSISTDAGTNSENGNIGDPAVYRTSDDIILGSFPHRP